jgi:hypothetical protein
METVLTSPNGLKNGHIAALSPSDYAPQPAWQSLPLNHRIDFVLMLEAPESWFDEESYIGTLAEAWLHDARLWGKALARYRELCGQYNRDQVADLMRAIEEYAERTWGISSQFPRNKSDAGTPHEIRGKSISSLSSLSSQGKHWPTLLPEALYGLAGDYVRAIEPHTEADSAALLIQFLTTFGIIAGRHRHFLIGSGKHYPNIFCVVAGLTAKARKGTSLEEVLTQMERADATWTRQGHIKSCGSGEGLIWAVRDPRMGKEPIKDKKTGRIIEYQEVEVDPGVEDKRGLYVTGEFSGTLKIAAREGNTLSEVIRDIWDTGHLKHTTKGLELAATDAHIGIIGHITIDEVRKLLTSTDMANGFANRFIWVCSRRSKLLPEGGNISSVNFTPLRNRLCKALDFSALEGSMQRDAKAATAWKAVYGMLSEDRTGLASTVLARAETQVVRLSMLYALLDCSNTIRLEHLNAALALWQYAEESAGYIFGEATGDDTLDAIMRDIRKAGERGLTRNDIMEGTFQRHVKAAEIERALHDLEIQGRITSEERKAASGKGRPSTVYRFVSCEESEESEENTSRYLIASNDAAKAMDIFSEAVRGNCEEIPSAGFDPNDSEQF